MHSLGALPHSGLQRGHPFPVRPFGLQDGLARLGLQRDGSIELCLSAPEPHRRWRGLLGAAPSLFRCVTRFASGAHNWVIPLHPLRAQLFDERHLVKPRLLQLRRRRYPVGAAVAATITRTRGSAIARLVLRVAEWLPCPLRLVAARRRGAITLATAPSLNTLEPISINHAPTRLRAWCIAP